MVRPAAHRPLSASTSAMNESSSSSAAASSSMVRADGHQEEAGEDGISVRDRLTITASISATWAVFAALIYFGPAGGWRYYLAGGICACTSHAIATPIDVVKTRQQVDPSLQNKGVLKTTLKIIKEDGVSGLLSGFGPTFYGYLYEGAIKFGIYEILKPATRRFLASAAVMFSLPALDTRLASFLVCGSFAGYAASVILCPMEALRIRMVAEPNFAHKGWVLGGMTMLHNEGLRGLYKGFSAMMSKQIPYTVTKHVSFDVITSAAYGFALSRGIQLDATNKVVIPIISAYFTSVLSCISSHPGDMLLSVVNAHEGDRKTRDFAKEIWQRDGLRGLFVGIAPRFLHVGIIVTMQMLIYDMVKRLCGCGITGLV